MKLYQIVFSPTGGTYRNADILSQPLSEDIVPVDLTDTKTDIDALSIQSRDVAVIAVPSYGGRVPDLAIQRLSAIKGNGARAVLVCVYGNRAFEDTLVELMDAVKNAGFHTIAAVSAIAEHSIARQFASGRPDEQDRSKLIEFAGFIQQKISADDLSEPVIPGNRPYKKAGGAGLVPKPTKKCTGCGICAEKCPTQAINKSNPKDVHQAACISCMRCVSVCPSSARKPSSVMLSMVGTMLKQSCSERKQCELYL